ncbi:hypothetical protein L596_022955 [Steinernema carpocapsae]|uniref:ShKT domain-containing protein n=1 Tax=Steinernema carpocapsae TaxID=34508 RepID=A0A4V5ZZ87_STECR|nr:hypothetical protein L596_022955 [Steinernema carpocapsae]
MIFVTLIPILIVSISAELTCPGNFGPAIHKCVYDEATGKDLCPNGMDCVTLQETKFCCPPCEDAVQGCDPHYCNVLKYMKKMQTDCARTCGFCECCDKHSWCPIFASNGFCNKGFYKKKSGLLCPVSCGLC